MPIRDLAADLDLTREDVLDWLKANKDRQPELAAKYPPEDEMVASVQIDPFDPRVRADGRDYDNVRDNRRAPPAEEDAYDSQTAYLRNARQAHGPRAARDKGYEEASGATNVATLEKVFAQDRFPDDSRCRRRPQLPEQDRRGSRRGARRTRPEEARPRARRGRGASFQNRRLHLGRDVSRRAQNPPGSRGWARGFGRGVERNRGRGRRVRRGAVARLDV